MILKDKGRILGIDDGPFSRPKDKFTPFVGVLMRMDGRIEGIRVGKLAIDGDYAEKAIYAMAASMGPGNINLIMSDGVTFAGFDIVSPENVYKDTGIPYVSITHSPADLESMEAALTKHGELLKIGKLKGLNPVKCSIHGSEFVVNYAGLGQDEALKVLERSMMVGNVPEPVRIADMIATSIQSPLDRE